jgi:tetratricopeptide (TPR) repeat protein
MHSIFVIPGPLSVAAVTVLLRLDLTTATARMIVILTGLVFNRIWSGLKELVPIRQSGIPLPWKPTAASSFTILRTAQNELEKEALRRVFAEKEVEVKRTIEEVLESGKKFLGEGKYLEALAEFSKVLKADPTHREALKLQSEAQFRMESQLIEQSKEEAKEYLAEAMKLVVLRKYKEALPQVEAALARDPQNKEAQALKKKLELILKLEK